MTSDTLLIGRLGQLAQGCAQGYALGRDQGLVPAVKPVAAACLSGAERPDGGRPDRRRIAAPHHGIAAPDWQAGPDAWLDRLPG